MATLDSSIVVVGLPQVVSDLKTNLVVGVWIITIYRLMITVLLVGIGRWADMHGRVRLYNMGFAIFTIGSLLSGLSPTAETLLAFRLVQGIGAALLFVNSVAIVTDAFSGKDLGKGIGINQVAINAGTITGYTLSGVLIQLFTWRSIFLVNVPIGIFGTYWSRKRLKEISRPAVGEKFDAAGAITFSIAITLLLLGLTLGSLTNFANQAVVSASILCFAICSIIERVKDIGLARRLCPLLLSLRIRSAHALSSDRALAGACRIRYRPFPQSKREFGNGVCSEFQERNLVRGPSHDHQH